MSQASFGLVANGLIVVANMTFIVQWDAASVVQSVSHYAQSEYGMEACAAAEASLKNLEDTVNSARPEDRATYKAGFEYLAGRITDLRHQYAISLLSTCDHADPSFQDFRMALYRLNVVDQPNRLINWHYRVDTKSQL